MVEAVQPRLSGFSGFPVPPDFLEGVFPLSFGENGTSTHPWTTPQIQILSIWSKEEGEEGGEVAAEAIAEGEEDQEDGVVVELVVPSNNRNATIQLTTRPPDDSSSSRGEGSTKITMNRRWRILFFRVVISHTKMSTDDRKNSRST